MMDFVKFAHDRNRMCNTQLGAGEGCKGCPLDQTMDKNSVCSVWCFANPEKAIEVVEQWVADYPAKTRQSEFLKQWPEAFYREGLLQICPACVSRSFRGIVGECVVEPKDCQKCKKDFWLAEVEE